MGARQMSNYAETMFSHADIEVPLENIKPMGDCVLVRVLPEEEVTASGIMLPQTGKDSSELRIGEVVAAGPGDKLFVWVCNTCLKVWDWNGPVKMSHKNIAAWREAATSKSWYRLTTTKNPSPCKVCGESNWLLNGIGHHEMHVKPGDRIWYRRVLANQQMINGELYQLIHEEQHVVAILEN